MFDVFIRFLYFIIPGIFGFYFSSSLIKILSKKFATLKGFNCIHYKYFYILSLSFISFVFANLLFCFFNYVHLNEYYYFDSFDYIFGNGNYGIIELSLSCIISFFISFLIFLFSKNVIFSLININDNISIIKNDSNDVYYGRVIDKFIIDSVVFIKLDVIEVVNLVSKSKKDDVCNAIISVNANDIIEIDNRGNV